MFGDSVIYTSLHLPCVSCCLCLTSYVHFYLGCSNAYNISETDQLSTQGGKMLGNLKFEVQLSVGLLLIYFLHKLLHFQ